MTKRRAVRKITVSCTECGRGYEAAMFVGDPLPQGRCVECATDALLRKWAAPCE